MILLKNINKQIRNILGENSQGLIIGKFFPLHKGHCFLIDMALTMCQDVHICLCTRQDEEIGGELRKKWLKEEYQQSNVHIYHITKEIEEAHAENPDAPKIWAEQVRAILTSQKIDYVFASESYGEDFAKELRAKFVLSDLDRDIVQISGTEIRQNIYSSWDYLADSVKPYYTKIICVSGDNEKILTLAENLGAYYNKMYVPIENDEDSTFKKVILLAKLEAIKKQNYPLIINHVEHDSKKVVEAFLANQNSKSFTVNSEDDIRDVIDWWMSIIS